jgi:pSer/pThr/pTyr-binding forkhead associated (FHA) protein
MVGRRHAVIEEDHGHFKISDLASTNGTFVNGRKIRQAVLLQPDDDIRFGPNYSVHFTAPGR